MGNELTAGSWPARLPVVLKVQCSRCRGLIDLACEGFGGTVIYETYNEYFCPYCRAQNHARTPGHIMTASPRAANAG